MSKSKVASITHNVKGGGSKAHQELHKLRLIVFKGNLKTFSELVHRVIIKFFAKTSQNSFSRGKKIPRNSLRKQITVIGRVFHIFAILLNKESNCLQDGFFQIKLIVFNGKNDALDSSKELVGQSDGH